MKAGTIHARIWKPRTAAFIAETKEKHEANTHSGFASDKLHGIS
jgi:hypothetical protein